jgi:hypothetical protein
MGHSNGALLGLKEGRASVFTPLLALWSEGWSIRALCLAALGLWILYVVGLIMWRDPSIDWHGIASQVQLFISDI